MSAHAIDSVYPATEIADRVGDLGRRLAAELPDDPLIVSLLGGSVFFLADLVRAIDRPVRYEFIHVERSGAGDGGSVLALLFPIAFSVAGESVLLLKDVVASGVVESYLLAQLRDHGAADVRLAALIDLPDERNTQVGVDYAVFSTGRGPGRLVGYGLKDHGAHGNLPYIGRLATGAAEA